MKKFYFRSFGDYFTAVIGLFVFAFLIWGIVTAIQVGKIGIAVLCIVSNIVLLIGLLCFYTMGRMLVTDKEVRIYAPGCMPKRFTLDNVRVIFIRFQKHGRRRWYEATVEVKLFNGESFHFDFYYSGPRRGRIGKVSPKRKARLEALAAECEKISCETLK